MDRPDLLRQLTEVAVDSNAAALAGGAVEQLTAVCATARVVFRAAAVSVAIVETDGLRYVASSGAGADEIVGVLLPFDRGLAGYVAVSGQSLAVDRPTDDPRFARDLAERTGLVPSSMLLVPIHDAEGDVQGVLSVLDRAIGSADALAIATAFAEQLSVMLPAAHAVATEAHVLLAALVDSVRNGDTDLADALDRQLGQLPEADAEVARAAGLLRRLRTTDPASRQRALALIGDVVDLVTSRRR